MIRRLGKKLGFNILVLLLLFGCISIPRISHPMEGTTSPEVNMPVLDPQAAEYLTNSSGTNQQANVTLHQAYTDSSTTNLNQGSTSFTRPAPNATGTTSSYTNISVNNIIVQNYTSTIETSVSGSRNLITQPYYHAASFTVIANCYVSNISISISKELGYADDGTISVYIMNSSWDTVDLRIEPRYASRILIDTITINQDDAWFNSTFLISSSTFLDNSLTYDKNWFICLLANNIGNDYQPLWKYNADSNGDNSKSYYRSGSGETWSPLAIDFCLKVGLSLNKNNVKPTDINLKINNTAVNNNPNSPNHNSGFWNKTGFNSNSANSINYVCSADWYLYSFVVNHTQLNFTKTATMNTTYTVQSNQAVYWTSQANFTVFDYRYNNYTINFTIPLSWTGQSLTKNSVSQTLPTPYLAATAKILSVKGIAATDGNWTLYSTSTNLLSNVKVGRGGIEASLAYSNETLGFNATFSKSVSGNVNLTVWSPWNNYELFNYTKVVGLTSTTTVNLGVWNVAQNITEYGLFKVQARWNNLTDIGIADATVFIAGAANFTMYNANNTELCESDSPFNISLGYADVVKDQNITGATIGYNFGLGGGWQVDNTQNNPDDRYTITVDPSLYSVGQHVIPITINKSSYMNYTIYFVFHLVTETQVWSLWQNSTLTVMRGQNATFYLNYNQTSDELGVSGATITASAVNASINWSFKGLTGGNYSIALNTSQLYVGTYPNQQFTISQTNYQTKSFSFSIIITKAQTSLTLINRTAIVSRASHFNETIYFYLTDTTTNKNITGMPSSRLTVINASSMTPWSVTGTDWWFWEIGGGKYCLNVSLNGVDARQYSVLLNASFTPNYNYSTLLVSFYVRGNYTQITIQNIFDQATTQALPFVNGKYQIYQHYLTIGIWFDLSDIEKIIRELTQSDGPFSYWVYLNDTTSLTKYLSYDSGDLRHEGTIQLPNDLTSGDYKITVIIGAKNYENGTYSFVLTINDLLTAAVFHDITQPEHVPFITTLPYNSIYHNYTSYIAYDVYVDVHYNDTITNLLISGATAVLNFNSVNYNTPSYITGFYRWILPKSALSVGTFNITITFSLEDYVTSVYSFNLSLYILPTQAWQQSHSIAQPNHNANQLTGNPYQAYLPYRLVINASYYDLNNSVYLGFSGTYAVLNFNGYNYTANYYGSNMFGFEISVGNLLEGTFPFTIYFGRINYANSSYFFQVKFDILPTQLSVKSVKQPTHTGNQLPYNPTYLNYTAYTAYTIEIQMNFSDPTNGGAGLSGATTTLVFRGITYYPTYGSGVYTWTLITDVLIPGTFNVSISFTLIFCSSKSYSFNVSLYLLPTQAWQQGHSITQPNHNSSDLTGDPYQAYLPYRLVINASYYDLNNSAYIGFSGAYAVVEFDGYNYSSTYYGSNKFGFVIPVEDLVEGIFTITIYFGKEDYTNSSYAFDIKFNYLPTTLTLTSIRQPAHPGHTNDQLPYNPINFNYTAYTAYNIVLDMTFKDPTNSNTNLPGANAILNFRGTPYSANYVSGVYTWTLTTVSLIPGTFNVTIYFNYTYAINRTHSFNLSIYNLPTESTFNSANDLRQPSYTYWTVILSDGAYVVLKHYYLVLNLTLWDLNNTGVLISGATLRLLQYNGIEITGTNLGSGRYGWIIPAANLIVGIHTVTIILGKQYYDNATFSLNLDVRLISAEVQFTEDIYQPEYTANHLVNDTIFGYIGYAPFDLEINATYRDINNTVQISSAYAVIEYNGQFYPAVSYSGGKYGWIIPTEDLILGTADLMIYFGKPDYANVTRVIRITIRELLTQVDFEGRIWQRQHANTTLEFVDNRFIVYLIYNLEIQANYYDLVGKVDLTEADYAVLEYNGVNYTAVEISSGLYRWIISQPFLVAGNFTLNIYFGKEIFSNATRAILIAIVPVPTNIQLVNIKQPVHSNQQLEIGTEDIGYIAYLPYDLTLNVTYRDTLNNVLITGAEITQIEYAGKLFTTSLYLNSQYGWLISIIDLILGTFPLRITLSKTNYEDQIYEFNLTVDTLPTALKIEEVAQSGENSGDLVYVNYTYGYRAYMGFDIQIEISFTDNTTDNPLTNLRRNQTIWTRVSSGTSVSFRAPLFTNNRYRWTIPAANLDTGTYVATIYMEQAGCDNQTLFVRFTIQAELEIQIELVQSPEKIRQGDAITLVFHVTYKNNSQWIGLNNAVLTLITNLREVPLLPNSTNATGYILFRFIIPSGNYTKLSMTLEYNGQQLGIAAGMEDFNLDITPLIPSWLLWLILLIIGVVGSVVVVQRGIIAPRKMRHTDIITSAATVFDDAVNLQHIMIIYKTVGTALYFKSFAGEAIDPVLISGFLSAVQSFGKELKSQKSLNELSYGDKILLFSDGEFIRVTLVLSKSASPLMKQNLARFVGAFENRYRDDLKNWFGLLDVFEKADDLVDDILNTSVILPHRITPDEKSIRKIKHTFEKQILQVGQDLLGTDRDFIFLAQLLSVAIEKTGKNPAEIIHTINELRDQKLLLPVKLEVLEEAISDQELRTLRERVWTIPNKTDDEKEKILGHLQRIPRQEREVTLASLMQTIKITTEITGETIETRKFESVKEVRQEIKRLEKAAIKALKTHQRDEAVRNYEIGEVLAYQWNLENDGKRFGKLALHTTIENHYFQVDRGTNEAKKAAKAKDYAKAVKSMEAAIHNANKLFQLGFVEMETRVKALTNKMAEYQKGYNLACGTKELICKENLIALRNQLLKEMQKEQKTKNIDAHIRILSRVLLLSTYLFKFGIKKETDMIKKYRHDLDILLKKCEDLPNEFKAQRNASQEEKKHVLESLEMAAKEDEQHEMWFDAFLKYQQMVEIFCELGLVDGAVYLAAKFKILLEKIPDLEMKLHDLENDVARLQQDGNETAATLSLERILLIRHALFLPENK